MRLYWNIRGEIRVWKRRNEQRNKIARQFRIKGKCRFNLRWVRQKLSRISLQHLYFNKTLFSSWISIQISAHFGQSVFAEILKMDLFFINDIELWKFLMKNPIFKALSSLVFQWENLKVSYNTSKNLFFENTSNRSDGGHFVLGRQS